MNRSRSKIRKKSCRVCAGNKSLVNILDPENKELIDILKIIANIDVQPNDKLPKQICADCKQGLEKTYKLRALGEANEKKFRDELDGDSEEDEITDEDEEIEDDPGIERLEDDINENALGDQEPYGESREIKLEVDPLDDPVNEEGDLGLEEAKAEPKEKEALKRKRGKPKNSPNKKVKIKKESQEDNETIETNQEHVDKVSVNIEVVGDVNDPIFADGVDTEQLMYTGELKIDMLQDFHRKVSRKPTSWQRLLERLKTGEKRFKCRECGVAYVKIASFVCHALKHTGEKSYRCRLPNCSSTYSNWRSLETHLIYHCDERKYVCEICGFSVKHRNGYYIHKRVHVDKAGKPKNNRISRLEKRRKVIEEEVRKEEELIMNQADEEEEDEDESVMFEKKNPKYDELLEFHKGQMKKKSKTWVMVTDLVKEGPTRFRCRVCGKEYKQKKDHIYHVLSHTGEKPMKCRVAGCFSGFRDWKKLKDHLISHCDERKHVCEICGNAYKFRFVLRKHMDSHNTDPGLKVQCRYCSALFQRKSDLSAHEKRHKPNEETLTKCELCDKTFLSNRGYKLNRHLKEEHGIQIVTKKEEKSLSKCDLCDHYFLAIRDLRSHLKEEHGVKVVFEQENEFKGFLAADNSDFENDEEDSKVFFNINSEIQDEEIKVDEEDSFFEKKVFSGENYIYSEEKETKVFSEGKETKVFSVEAFCEEGMKALCEEDEDIPVALEEDDYYEEEVIYEGLEGEAMFSGEEEEVIYDGEKGEVIYDGEKGEVIYAGAEGEVLYDDEKGEVLYEVVEVAVDPDDEGIFP